MPLKQFLEAGQIVGTHGVRGEMRVQPWCDSPEVFCTLKTVYMDENGKQAVKVKSRPQKNMVLMKMDGVDSIPEAEALRNKVVYLNRKDLKLEKGAYFIDDIIGSTVVDVDSGAELGELFDVSSTGSNDVFHMRLKDGQEILIPKIDEVVKEIDIEKGIVKIFVIKGLLEDDEN